MMVIKDSSQYKSQLYYYNWISLREEFKIINIILKQREAEKLREKEPRERAYKRREKYSINLY
jgi:hypothetical protein